MISLVLIQLGVAITRSFPDLRFRASRALVYRSLGGNFYRGSKFQAKVKLLALGIDFARIMVMPRPLKVVAEALAVHKGLMFARDACLLPCVVETNAQMVVKLIDSDSTPLSDVGIVINDILEFLDCHPIVKVIFASRKTNMTAHRLAKLGFSIDSALFWMEEVLPCVALIVFGDRLAQL
ncbi:hypothetical protein Dsin_022190 [Dipteronia sinensis]|uniref:RNase H type-1 domain-containing protein n=1 Tax=Dipteronia sinensis TaxID=43782 RepID=A0AAE0DZI6_9ROSI|nr:hypothetical protein Dsin_022190 [Dipteronia sinensis]